MARIRISRLAQADLIHILSTSEGRWGPAARRRYSDLVSAAFRAIAADPALPTSRDRGDLSPGVRSLHLRHVGPDRGVGRPVHLVYFRPIDPGVVEIVRVLHDRMEPRRHVGGVEPEID